MKAAFSVWNGRVAPVFDVSRHVRIVDAASGTIVHEEDETLPDDSPFGKATRLANLGAEVLVCGAISRPVQAVTASRGIRVIPFIAGDIEKIIGAWLDGTLGQGAFAMPGLTGTIKPHVKT